MDFLHGEAGADDLQGCAGDDLLLGGSGGELIDGGAGFDTVSYAGAINPIYVYLPHGRGYWGDSAGDFYTDVERYVGGESHDWFYGVGDDEVFEAARARTISSPVRATTR